MRLHIQRVSQAKVIVANKIVGQIKHGLLALLGVHQHDTQKQINFLVDKCLNLRIFNDENGKMNRSLLDVQGEILVISNFTLYADTHKGRRPNYMTAAPPELAEKLYRNFVEKCKQSKVNVQTGVFAAMMDVNLTNNGPVTMLLEK